MLAAARRQDIDTIPITPRTAYAAKLHFGDNDLFADLRLKTVYDYDPQIIIGCNAYPFFDPYADFRETRDVRLEISIGEADRTRRVSKRYQTPDGTLSEEFLVPMPGNPEYGENPNPVHLEYLVKDPEDLLRLRHLMPAVDPDAAVRFRNIEGVVCEQGLCLATVYGALDHQAGSVVSMEDIMIGIIERPGFVSELIGLFQEQIIAQTRALLEGGVKNFFCPYYYHSISAGWSPDHYRSWFLPLVSEQVALVHSYDGLMFYYDDGKHMEILPFLVEAGVDVVETCTPPPVGDFDLVEAKRLFGDRITFKGYIDLIYVLQKGGVDDVREAVRFACETGGAGGGFILGTSDSIRSGTPKENIDAYFRYGREFGGQ